MRFTVLISLLMMLIHTTSSAETTNNLVSQDFTTGWSGTNVDTTHGSGTIAGVDGEYVVSDSVSLSTDVGLNKPTINNGFTITGSSEIWFWNSYTQSVTQTIRTEDDNGNVITQNRIISGVQNGYQTYSDKLIINSNTQSDYDINLRYDFSVPGTTGHYGADLKNPSLTVEYTFKEELNTTTESNLVALADTIEDDVYFQEIKFEDEVKMDEEFTFNEPIMDDMKEEDKLDEPAFEEFAMVEDDKEEEEPIMDTMEMFTEEEKEEDEPVEMMAEAVTEEENEKEEESNSETTESSNAEDEGDTQQEKSVQQKETKTARLEGILEKIDQEIKDIDKNLQLKNLVKLKVMSGDNILEAYNIPFYEPKEIYIDQVDIADNRIIYDVDLIQYKQNDPIFQKKQQLNIILQQRQNLINEIEVLTNG